LLGWYICTTFFHSSCSVVNRPRLHLRLEILLHLGGDLASDFPKACGQVEMTVDGLFRGWGCRIVVVVAPRAFMEGTLGQKRRPAPVQGPAGWWESAPQDPQRRGGSGSHVRSGIMLTTFPSRMSWPSKLPSRHVTPEHPGLSILKSFPRRSGLKVPKWQVFSPDAQQA
jgi:hypothetical protein